MSSTKLLEGLIYFFVFCPNIQIIVFGTDTQPYALVFSLTFLLIYLFKKDKIRVPKSYGWFMIPGVIALGLYVLGIIQTNFFEATRSMLNYLTILVIPLSSYYLFQICGGLKEQYVKWLINFWLIVAVIQKFFISDFMYFCIAGHRTTEERGVVSLMSEPSFYGYMCIFAMLFVLDFKSKKERNIYLANLVIQIFLFAESSITILYLMIIVGVYVLSWFCRTKINLNMILLALGVLLIGVVAVVIILNFFQGSRLGSLVWYAVYTPTELLNDASIQERMSDIVMALRGFWENRFMPHGFGAGRIMSGFGAALYECGFFACALIYAFYIILRGQNSGASKYHIEVSLCIIMFSAVQLSLPILSFYLGYCLYNRKEHKSRIVWGKKRVNISDYGWQDNPDWERNEDGSFN